MKYLPLLYLSILLLTVTSCTKAQNVLSPTEFSQKLEKTPNAILLDVRSPEEYSGGHLKNAKNIDWNGTNFDQQISKLDKTKPVFVYCLAGGRSASAASHLKSKGFTKVYDLEGGIGNWRKAKLPETAAP